MQVPITPISTPLPQDQDASMVPTESLKTELDDLEDMDLEDLDLQGIATACERKEEHSIPDQQIRLLQSALDKIKKQGERDNHSKR
jgi:hypothetical protein